MTFVVVKEAVATFPPVGFVAWRFAVAAALLLPLTFPARTSVWREGIIAGSLLFAGYALQTAGLTTTEATNSALITGLYVVLTPLVVAVTRRRPPSPWAFVSAVLAFIGTGLLTLRDGLRLGSGDLLTLGCALAFAGHIVYLAKTAHRHPVIPFTAVQLATTAALGFAVALPTEGVAIPVGSQWAPILLTGLGVSGGAYLLQVWAQTILGPARTSVVLTLEPVFGVAAGLALLGERLAAGGWVGAVLIVVAIHLVLTRASADDTVEAEAVTPAH